MKSYTIASALIELQKTSDYIPQAFARFCESGAVNKFNRNSAAVLIYADFSALLIDGDKINLPDDDAGDIIELIARLQVLPNNKIRDIPAFWRYELLKYLRANY